MKIHFLYGTETGSAEMLCEDIRDDLGDGFECELTSLGDIDPTTLNNETFYIFATSTYGNGDLPVTAQPFYDTIVEKGLDLSHIRFAIYGLGDMVFAETFAFGSKIMMEKLLEQGATMIGERCIHDASSPDLPEDLGIPWAHDILAQLKAQAA